MDESSSGEGEDTVEEEIPEYLFKLFIADRGNSRVAVWNELPIPPTDEGEGDEGDQIEVEDLIFLLVMMTRKMRMIRRKNSLQSNLIVSCN